MFCLNRPQRPHMSPLASQLCQPSMLTSLQPASRCARSGAVRCGSLGGSARVGVLRSCRVAPEITEAERNEKPHPRRAPAVVVVVVMAVAEETAGRWWWRWRWRWRWRWGRAEYSHTEERDHGLTFMFSFVLRRGSLHEW